MRDGPALRLRGMLRPCRPTMEKKPFNRLFPGGPTMEKQPFNGLFPGGHPVLPKAVATLSPTVAKSSQTNSNVSRYAHLFKYFEARTPIQMFRGTHTSKASDIQDVLAQTTRGEKSAYSQCWIAKFVLVTRTTREYPQLSTGVCLGGGGHLGLDGRTGFMIYMFVALSGTLRGHGWQVDATLFRVFLGWVQHTAHRL